MSTKLKPPSEQVIVITGASSGIGLATAETACARGAKVVLAARSVATLRQIAAGLSADRSEAIAVACDVSDQAQIENVAKQAIEQFGRIDTWINDAGLGMYGLLEETDLEDSHRLFEINFWGVVHGSLADHLP
jgi:NADP-dependent 3-hydroxy acid dehydrogenase YdfG